MDVPTTRAVLPMLAVYMVMVLVLATVLSGPAFQLAFSEHGIVEMINAIAWLAAALVFAGIAWRARERVAVLSVFPLFAAALREADFHSAFTGYSVLKVSFWFDGRFDPWHKLLAAAVLVPTLVSLGWLSVLLVRRLRRGGLGSPAMSMLLLAIGLLVFSKICDRAPAVLYESNVVDLPMLARKWTQALEEGLELTLPFFFACAYLLRGDGSMRAQAE
jgi:hypothetical protein